MNAIAHSSYPGKAKYCEATARAYQQVNPSKNAAELSLVERAFSLIPKGNVLDVPCGGGRVSLRLAQMGYQIHAADISPAMINIASANFARAGLPISVDDRDVEDLGFPDAAFDAVVCFRLFHHFPDPSIRRRAIAELCRVARHHVALSYFSPWSPTSLQRKWRCALTGRRSRKFATSIEEVKGYFETAGFRLVRDFARMPFLHTLHLAVFQRV